MNKWFISDHHFCHFNIIKYCNRPFRTASEMDKFMIEKWNSVVKDDDLVIHGGDFALGAVPAIRSIFQQLKGRKIIIKGNHDRLKVLRAIGFDDIREYYYEDGVLFCHYPDKNVPKQLYEECKLFLYGHIHNNPFFNPPKKSLNACVENHDYTPFTLNI